MRVCQPSSQRYLLVYSVLTYATDIGGKYHLEYASTILCKPPFALFQHVTDSMYSLHIHDACGNGIRCLLLWTNPSQTVPVRPEVAP